MSTRANIVLTEKWGNKTSKLFFYRHSDGYPEGTMPTLNVFMKWLKSGQIRNNLSQSAGWLILLGAIEYNTLPEYKTEKPHFDGAKGYADINTIQSPHDWKCGAYEPTTSIHGDIEYLYIIDVTNKTLECFEDWTAKGEGKGTPVDLKEYV